MRHIIPHSTSNLAKFFLLQTGLFGTILDYGFSRLKTLNALIRTTMAPTIIKGGVQNNVIPSSVMARINLRIHPNDNIPKIKEHFKKIVDPKIRINEITEEIGEASELSCFECIPFQIIAEVTEKIYGKENIITTPFLFIAGSDSKFYRKVSKHSYGFTAAKSSQEDINGIHGFNERISFENYFNLIDYFYNIIQNFDKFNGK
jgi:carboxypeptidase PM20D1